jgi:alditol oxidase
MTRNWAGNVTFGAARVHRPASVPELQGLVARAGQVRALGTGHSFNPIADTPGDLIDVTGLPRLAEIDSEDDSVTVSAGLRYGELAVELNRAGRALANLGSLPHISVAGACATGTHGSGDANGCLATSVRAIEMVTADGELMTVSRAADPECFPGSVVALGALGVVTRLTLGTVPSFPVRQYVYDDVPWTAVTGHLDEIFATGYSVSVFTTWRTPRTGQVWVKQRTGTEPPGKRWPGGRPADGPRHPVPGMPAGNSTAQLGVPGPWHERLPHFRLEFTPSAGDELQSEYLMSRAHAADALAALEPIAADLAALVQVSELRTVAADDLWLSPAYQRDTIGIHFTWVNDWPSVAPVLTRVEQRLAPLHARPHWGKLFHTAPAGLYERAADFRGLMHHHDPSAKFRNEFVDRCLLMHPATSH